MIPRTAATLRGVTFVAGMAVSGQLFMAACGQILMTVNTSSSSRSRPGHS